MKTIPAIPPLASTALSPKPMAKAMTATGRAPITNGFTMGNMLADHHVDQDDEETAKEAIEAAYDSGTVEVQLKVRCEKRLRPSKESTNRDRRRKESDRESGVLENHASQGKSYCHPSSLPEPNARMALRMKPPCSKCVAELSHGGTSARSGD